MPVPLLSSLPEEGTSRLEAFSDGVFAIAITLLVLELHVPRPQPGHPFNLLGAVVGQWPVFFAWALSIVVVGIYWANHHYLFRFYTGTDHYFRLLNVLFLMCITFLPYPTQVLGSYILVPGQERAAVQIYCVGLLLPCLGWWATWSYARWAGLVDSRLTSEFVASISWRNNFSTVPFLLALLVSEVSWACSLVLQVAVMALWLLPPPRPRYLEPSL